MSAIKPLFTLTSNPNFNTSNEWLEYWVKRAWNDQQKFDYITFADVSLALRHIEADPERILLIRAFYWFNDTKLAYGSILALYAQNHINIIPRIKEIDDYHDAKLHALGVTPP